MIAEESVDVPDTIRFTDLLSMEEASTSQDNPTFSVRRFRTRSLSYTTELNIETELLRYRVFQIGAGFFSISSLIAGALVITYAINDIGAGAVALCSGIYSLVNIVIGFVGSLKELRQRFTYMRVSFIHCCITGLFGLALATISGISIAIGVQTYGQTEDFAQLRFPLNTVLLFCGTALAGLQILSGLFAYRALPLLMPFSAEQQ